MKIKLQFLKIFLIVSILFLSCKNVKYSVTDLEGMYESYTYKYGGLFKKKQRINIQLQSNNIALINGCQQVKCMWYINDLELIIIPFVDASIVDSSLKTTYKIISSNAFKIENEMFLDTKTRTDTMYLNQVFIKNGK